MQKCTSIGKMALGVLFILMLTIAWSFAQEKKGTTKAKSVPPKTETKAKPEGVDPNAKVALVNGKPVLRSDLDTILKNMKGPQGANTGDEPTQEMTAAALDHAITLEVLKQECTKQHIEVTDVEVDERIGQIKKNFPGDKEFDAMLAKMNMTQARLKETLKTDMTIRKLIDREVAEKVTVSDAEVKDYYDKSLDTFKHPEQVRASHILVKIGPDDKDEQKAEARKKIEDIQKKLQAGGDFEALAKDNSDCPSKIKGGDLGYFDREAMVKPFSDAAFALKPGETSGIVETQFGYHIIRLTDKKAAGTQSFDEVKDDIGRYLKQSKVKDDVKLYIENLKKNAKIEKMM